MNFMFRPMHSLAMRDVIFSSCPGREAARARARSRA
jgi:hypothetical protein